MENKLSALADMLIRAIDIVAEMQNDSKKGSEGKREPQGGWGVRRDKGSEGLTEISDILTNSVIKRLAHQTVEKDAQKSPKKPDIDLPKITCPYSSYEDPKYACTDPCCKFGEFWAEYAPFRSSGKWRAHIIYKRLTQRRPSLADVINHDVVTRKLKHAGWQVDKKYRPHATTHLNGRHWEDPIEDIQHERSAYKSNSTIAKIHRFESALDKAVRQRDEFRAEERRKSETIIN